MDGAPELSSLQRSHSWDPLQKAENIISAAAARIVYDQSDRAFYSVGRDSIHMPSRSQFKDQAAYYGVLLHEHGHWTGAATRLNRDLSGAFGSESYAIEELRAELFSYFISDQLGIPHDPTRHASYVQSWIRALQNDKNEIFRAARDAEQITEYVLGLERTRATAANSTLSTIHRRVFDNLDRNEAQEAIARAVETNPEPFLTRFAELPQSLGGRFVSADLMKETFRQYTASKESRAWLNSPAHNAAAVLAAEQLRRVLAEPAEPGRETVLLVTGIPGAGKTSMVLESGALPSSAHAVYEGQLAESRVAVEKVRQVLEAGLQPQIVVVTLRPEQALDNTLSRFEEVGRGASVALMARIQSGLSEGLQAVRAEFGDRVALQIIDRRDPQNTVELRGWQNLKVVESEGTYEHIKERLATHLEERRPAISEAAYRQAAGLEPRRAERQVGEADVGERSTFGDRPASSGANQEALVLGANLARARAFERLPQNEAIAKHPELQSQYEIWRNLERSLAAQFPEDSLSRSTYTAAARKYFVKQLERGKLLVEDPSRREQLPKAGPATKSGPAAPEAER